MEQYDGSHGKDYSIEQKKPSKIDEFYRKLSSFTKAVVLSGCAIIVPLTIAKVSLDHQGYVNLRKIAAHAENTNQIRWVRHYGTLENPAFLLKESDSEFFSLNDFYLQKRQEIEEKEKQLEELVKQSTLDPVERNRIIHERDGKSFSRMLGIYAETALKVAQISGLDPAIFDSTNKEKQDLLKYYDNELERIKKEMKEFGKNIAKQSNEKREFYELGLETVNAMLTKEFNTGLKINVVKEIEGETAGSHNHFNNEINVEDTNQYYINLWIYFHEIGHAIYQGYESFERKADKTKADRDSESFKKAQKESLIMEEAAAYLFTIAAAKELQKNYPSLAEMILGQIQIERGKKTEEYSKGADDEHNHGAALAEVLLEHFKGNCSNAFNYLSTRNRIKQLSPEIAKIYSSREHFRKRDESSLKHTLDKRVASEMENLGERSSSFLSDYFASEERRANETQIEIIRHNPEKYRKNNLKNGKRESGKKDSGRNDKKETEIPEDKNYEKSSKEPRPETNAETKKPEEKKDYDPCEDDVNTARAFDRMQAGCEWNY